ncbi:Ger(x)C family spore germination protein [Paenisporosarcina sp. FSL H8-0542]|uniref:Ger(x)C family spore germination protein n=1 Tax=unclassified Paenisporosarcina TaxID=2642018 RepID=UPI00034E7413|nr:Ger(x)C family spore germination protein [Paenisporosarcina sp. HGH0030]EPD51387.1 Ger(X)C family germination protein [Paenisporosarcina sp. HGH0030]
MKNYLMLFVVSLLLLLSGCSTEQGSQPSLERLGMISVIAFDYIDEDKMKITVIMPQPATEAMKHTQAITVETDMLHKGLVEIASKADKAVTLEQLRVALFSEEFAEKGQMKEMVEFLYKDTEVRSNTFVAVVKDSAEELLRKDYPDKQNTSVYLNNLFQPRQYTYFSPFTTIHDFVYDETNPLLDSIAPYVEYKEGIIHIKGIAVFADGEMVTMFTQQEGKAIQILRGQKKLSVLTTTLDNDEKEKVALEFIKSKAKIKTNQNFNSPKVFITMEFEGNLSEYEGGKNLANDHELANLEKEVSKSIEKDVRILLEKCRQLSIEPTGLFETMRMRYKGDWPSDLTQQLMAKAEFEIKAETTILSAGALK